MDYWANVDAVTWFAHYIFPGVRAEIPDARFFIVGSNPTPEVIRLGSLPGICVTGRVDDVRPYLAHCAAAVAPLRVARGTQNKVLEALSMGKPVVATTAAVDGLVPWDDNGLMTVFDDPDVLIERSIEILRTDSDDGGSRRRRYITEHYDWGRNGVVLGEFLEGRGVGSLT